MKLIAKLYPKQGEFGEPIDGEEMDVEFSDVVKYEISDNTYNAFFLVHKANGEIHATRQQLIKSFKLIND